MTGKRRLDVFLVERGDFESRARAQAAIMAGTVCVNGQMCDKAGTPISPDAQVEVAAGKRWVSRGAEKLNAAVDHWNLSCAGKICMDIGAGSGGFTQVLLEHGASRVYAVDVGYGQFDSKLRGHPSVILLERTNARELSRELIPDPIEILAMDVSFISIFKVLPAIRPLLAADFSAVVLFKPNFEARREEVQKGGLLLDRDIHIRLLTECRSNLESSGWFLADIIPSPIRGGDGNIEYLLRMESSSARVFSEGQIAGIVSAAFAE